MTTLIVLIAAVVSVALALAITIPVCAWWDRRHEDNAGIWQDTPYQPRHTGVWPMPERTIADDLHDQADAIDNAIDDGWDPDATSWNMVAVPDDRKRAWQNKIRTAPAPVARQMAEAGWKA